ncbi:MAG: YitT family protein [Bacillota bacterium]
MDVSKYPCKLMQIVLGAFIAALSVNFFIVPKHLLVGGVSGMALIAGYLIRAPFGSINFILNVPLFFVAYFYLHRGFVWRSLLGMTAFSFFLILTRDWVWMPVPDTMLSALMGGILNGLGFGLIFKGRGSCGGTDIVAVMLHRFLSFHIGAANFLFNLGILTLAGLVFRNINMAGYTLVSLFVTSYVVDRIQIGFNTNKTVLIITGRSEEIAAEIISKVHRGVTFLNGEGAYARQPKKVILTTISLTQLARLKDLVVAVDPAAFMVVNDAVEVLGKGFEKMLEYAE